MPHHALESTARTIRVSSLASQWPAPRTSACKSTSKVAEKRYAGQGQPPMPNGTYTRALTSFVALIWASGCGSGSVEGTRGGGGGSGGGSQMDGAPGVGAPPPGPGPSLGGCNVFPGDNPWNTSVA